MQTLFLAFTHHVKGHMNSLLQIKIVHYDKTEEEENNFFFKNKEKDRAIFDSMKTSLKCRILQE